MFASSQKQKGHLQVASLNESLHECHRSPFHPLHSPSLRWVSLSHDPCSASRDFSSMPSRSNSKTLPEACVHKTRRFKESREWQDKYITHSLPKPAPIAATSRRKGGTQLLIGLFSPSFLFPHVLLTANSSLFNKHMLYEDLLSWAAGSTNVISLLRFSFVENIIPKIHRRVQ